MDTICKHQQNADKLTLQWLGTPNIEINGRAIRLETQKAVALLAYLSLANQPVPREALAAMFWPEFDQSHAFANLRRNLASLDKSLGYCWIDANRSTISFRKSENLFIDIVSYFDLIKQTRQHCRSSQAPCKECLNRLEQAANLYRDEFLSCLNFKNCNNFDEWQYFQREEASLELAIVLRRLSEGYAAIGNLEHSIRYARRWVKLDRLNEEAQRFLIHLYSQAGQRGTALRQYDEFLRLLTAELGQAPEPETVAMYEKICVGRPTPKNAFSFGIPIAFSNGAPEPLHGACSALTLQHYRLAHQDPMP